MIDDDVARAAARRKRVDFPTARRGASLAGADPDVLDDHVVSCDADTAANEGDTGRRRSLAREGQMRVQTRPIRPTSVVSTSR